jgi:hypothetical protein
MTTEVLYSTLRNLPPPQIPLSEDAGIEPRTVAILAMAVRDALTTRLDLIISSTI